MNSTDTQRIEFKLLEKVNTQANTPLSESLEKIRFNVKRPIKRFHEMESFKKIKGQMPIALIGGGPSVLSQIDVIKNFDGPTIACGSSHDWMINNGIIPTYCVLCDPDPITANYITKPVGTVIYLVATQCDNLVFDRLKYNAVYMWHCYNENFEDFNSVEPGFQAIGGGCTVGLRALSIAMMLGYRNIHFFGFDSCLGENDRHHAYDFTTDTEELGEILLIKLDPNSSKTYRAAGYQMAQASHFKNHYEIYNEFFTPTFHGEGLLPDLMSMINNKVKELKNGSV